ncbi:MAG: hypothetical protein GX601_18165 [Anaerolineales bacterium]|nr:hypothetical protein [Anaerolineales bacterium]
MAEKGELGYWGLRALSFFDRCEGETLAGVLLRVDKYNVTVRPAGAASTLLMPKHAVAWIELPAKE